MDEAKPQLPVDVQFAMEDNFQCCDINVAFLLVMTARDDDIVALARLSQNMLRVVHSEEYQWANQRPIGIGHGRASTGPALMKKKNIIHVIRIFDRHHQSWKTYLTREIGMITPLMVWSSDLMK
ncbi:hypothetical protein H5410_053454 [Solanum commersonii]|uniref:Uncharacterized protein n=1 Tax=Solanum commersonii TaxID=4109 RepID=A0A9J5X3W6_SOLCO|nr:hypothetical protein H5410_053454 [Solanum commersonii]